MTRQNKVKSLGKYSNIRDVSYSYHEGTQQHICFQ